MLVASDIKYDPQAFIFTPENTIKISEAIVNESDCYLMTKAAVVSLIQITSGLHQ